MQFTVFGEPKAKGRPRFARRGAFISTYTDKDTLAYETLVKFAYLEACANNPQLLEGEVVLHIDAFFSIPKSTSKKKAVLMLIGSVRHTKKPDIDNLCKSILDGLNKVAFKDDSQIVCLVANKFYSDTPRVEITIEASENM